MGSINDNLARILARITATLAAAGDPAREVTIIAVTKGHDAGRVRTVAAAGLVDVGESRVQEARAKIQQVPESLRWHLIGHLQRNKAKLAASLFQTIHSVDSLRLVDALAATEVSLAVFLQINVSGEESKFGAPPEDARTLLRAARSTSNLTVEGLMTMAPFTDDPSDARPYFAALRQIRDSLDETGDGPPLKSLSMGMSRDFEVAVQEGSTHVRIGTALVGERRGPVP